MHIAHQCALAGALLPLLGIAQAQIQPPAADPAAAVPPTLYRPAIVRRPDILPETTPDRGWADSNAAVAGYNPMALTMKQRPTAAPGAAAAPDPHAGHAGHHMPMDTPADAPAAPASQRKESP
jgi:hypothetical protein